MAAESLSSPSDPSQSGGRRKPPGFVENALKNKGSYVQLFFMTGILLLSMRSLGQKYRIHDLQEDTSSLKEEHESLTLRMASIKNGLLHEASLDPTGLFASKLRALFGDDSGGGGGGGESK